MASNVPHRTTSPPPTALNTSHQLQQSPSSPLSSVLTTTTSELLQKPAVFFEHPWLRWSVQISLCLVALWTAVMVVCLIADVPVPFGSYLALIGSSLSLYIAGVILASAGKRVVSFCLACSLYLVAIPFGFTTRFTIVRRGAVLLSIATVYLLVVCERYVRWFLSLFVGIHPDTGKPYSLVSACDTNFEGFVPLWDPTVPTISELKQQAHGLRTTADNPPPAGAELQHNAERSEFASSSSATASSQRDDDEAQRFVRPRANSLSNYLDVDEDDTPYSVGYALSLALASKLAYESSEIIKCEAEKWGFTRCDVVRYHNAKAFVASNDKAVMIVFAGTHPLNITHYVTDLSATLVPIEQLGYVHSGFMKAVGMHVAHKGTAVTTGEPPVQKEISRVMWRQVLLSACTNPVKKLFAFWEKWVYPPTIFVVRKMRKLIGLDEYYQKAKINYAPTRASTYTQILDILDKLEFIVEKRQVEVDGVPCNEWRWRKRRLNEHRKLWLGGHSLGGAMATIFTSRLVKDFPFITDRIMGGVYTFGQPRLGDVNFARFIERTVGPVFFRFVNDNDLVPRLPLAIPAWLVRLLLKRRDKTSIYRLRNSLLCFIAGVNSDETTNYTHVGTLKYINSDEQIVDGASSYRLIYLQLAGLLNSKVIANLKHESWLRISLRFLLPFFINDHMISDYIHAIRKNQAAAAASSSCALPTTADDELTRQTVRLHRSKP
eukprot:TRINITY_DN942_c0_g1_i1.p1 TRINITY_DN942_c0_g1~~TRINITY_DN942_c0_g1_i1.p1  ORF type:complete len:718 (+),score=90.75 TRINITY_DN942_c0_g1_i1:170-2323(+)